MSVNRGKDFELKLRDDFKKTVPNSTIDRIYDTVNGLRGVSNICDFIGFSSGIIFYLEAKSHAGASIPFDNITQYEKLKKKHDENIPGVRTGVVLWLIDKDVVLYIPVSTITKMKLDGKKSVGITAVKEGYNIKVLPSVKKRVYMNTDYSSLLELEDGE